MVYIGRDLKDHLVPTPLPWAGIPPTRSGFSKPQKFSKAMKTKQVFASLHPP